jgi:bisphosphoglycerate-independent phosphoglycerate mutase (AlkP superfamily)
LAQGQGSPREIFRDNTEKWNGDQLMEADEVPAILMSSRQTDRSQPSLLDLAPTILAEFGIAKPRAMTGNVLFSRN